MTPNFELTPIRKAAARLRIAGIGAFAVSLVATSSVAQKSADPRLSPIEQRIRDYVRAHENEQIGFLEKAVNINSGTFNLTGVREVGKLFAPQFAALGFDTTWIALPDAVGRAGHFFAERKGNRGKRMILLGHLDTVFEGEGENSCAWTRWLRVQAAPT